MDEIKYSIRISPEVLKSDITKQTFSGDSGIDDFGVYTKLPYLLSGNTGGSSFLTGLTIPIVFTQTINDLGVYTAFDGDIIQKDVITNFLYSASTTNPYQVNLYNTSGNIMISFLSFSNFYVNWGDGPQVYQIQDQPISHNYPATPSAYTITFSGVNNWGTSVIQKQIVLPATGATISNLQGTVTFTPQSGNWSGIPTTYDFIFTGDSENNFQSQVSSSYVQVPFPVSGFTTSRLKLLKKYGPNPYVTNYVFTNNLGIIGQIDAITPEYTAYTVHNIQYYDFPNNTTLFIANSSGFTEDNITVSAITKNETFLDFVMNPEIQNGVFIERGKYTAFEGLQRLGEVDNIGDLQRYGYNYFKINSV